MKNQSAIAEKYALALFEVASEKKLVEEFKTTLKKVVELLSAEDFDILLNSPVSSQISFKEMAKTALTSAIPDKELQSFFLILIDKGRLGLLPSIVDEFFKRADQKEGIMRGEVRSSRTLKDNEIQKLTSAVEENLNQKVSLNFNVDPSLIGGFEINVGGYRFVDSIKGHLNKLNEVVRRSTN